jgi:hypothetical protein
VTSSAARRRSRRELAWRSATRRSCSSTASDRGPRSARVASG